jgi:membrane-associated phospholipid phosphatase
MVSVTKGRQKCILLLIMALVLRLKIYGQETGDAIVPVSKVFHNIGFNALHSFSFNYGLNFIGAGLGTGAFVGSGIDWQWNRLAYNNTWLAYSGLPSLYIGYVVPAVTPLAFYITGRYIKDEKLQITGLALTQTLVLTLGIQSVLKMGTGRALPGIITELDHTRSSRTDDFSGEFDWFNMNSIGGWPSGHTANAFAAAATITEIYRDNLPLKIALYSYAGLIGLGVSVNVHWASDVFAGALIGYAIGKTVGKSFYGLLNNKNDKISLYVLPDTIGLRIRL